jgi:nucleoside-diphosphate-sugar epimerase
MSNKLVFITGGTGHIGFKTLVLALQAGYKVRAAVCSVAKKDNILTSKSIEELNPGADLTFVIIPDLTVEGAYDEAVIGATYIIYLASPIVLKGEILPENLQSALITPAISATISILKAANKTTGVQRIVITSSIVAIIHAKYFFEIDTPEGSVWKDTDRIDIPQGPVSTHTTPER